MWHRVFDLLPPWAGLLLAVGLLGGVLVFAKKVFKPRTLDLQGILAANGSPHPYDHEHPILDTRFGYTAGEVRVLFTQLGEKGREQYRASQLSDDLIFPWIYGAFFAALLGVAFCRVWDWDRQRWLLLLPLVVMLLDYGENLMIAKVLIPSWDSLSVAAVGWASYFTQAKLASLLAVFVVAATGALLTLRDFWFSAAATP
jgi:hypothetical protein